MAPNLPPSVYDLKAGNPNELIRHRQTDDLSKLWEWLNRYQEREGVTEILVTHMEPSSVKEIPVAPGIAIAKIEFGAPIVMLALQRKNQESPWTEVTG